MRLEPLAQRAYSDFTPRSAIPWRDDGNTRTVRNSPIMVNLGEGTDAPRLLHFDGEFATAQDLIVETLTGRNMGWQFDERASAIAHIARVIREDAGENARYVRGAQGRGIPYSVVMLGTDPSLPPYLRLRLEYRLDVRTASDAEVLQAIARFINAYMDSLRFGTEDTNRTRGSPYDLFLKKNEFPEKPAPAESSRAYARRLLASVQQRQHFAWVTPEEDGEFRLHDQAYEFGEAELAGLKIFFGELDDQSGRKLSVGNCVECHTPPLFTDRRFHNTGVSQVEYDSLFGAGAFDALDVPDLHTRNSHVDAYLPASRQHPHAVGRFRSAPSRELPGFADLGAWNIFANPDFPKPQAALMEILCSNGIRAAMPCTPEAVLPFTIGLFKTPSIRDLGHSSPYFHSGTAETIEDVLVHYLQVSRLARKGRLRNGASELTRMHLNESDIGPLAAFLKSLNEDYH